MTNKEAIERLEELLISITTRAVVWSLHTQGVELEALAVALDALREKAEKERRFVVRVYDYYGEYFYGVYDNKIKFPDGDRVAAAIPNTDDGKKAATRIADIYEEMYR